MSLPNNIPKPRVFLDASALFAAVFSSTGGARMILRLAEGDAVELVISSHILAEVEGALRRKAPDALGYLALLLDRAHCQTITNPSWEQIDEWKSVISYLPDTSVLAAAVAAGVDYLVTLDRKHFLENPCLMSSPPLPVGTPGDFLEWLRRELDRWHRS